jgi:putative solute:sodium symporter small subunit
VTAGGMQACGVHPLHPSLNEEMSVMREDAKARAYWSATLGLLTKVLVIWFVVPYLGGIFFAEQLNAIKLGGYPLGFWIAHQGSIYLFIVLIFWYAKKMGDIDRQFDVHEN